MPEFPSSLNASRVGSPAAEMTVNVNDPVIGEKSLVPEQKSSQGVGKKDVAILARLD